jgi:hypothetical protein
VPLSDDPDKRARQLANLRPGAGAWKPGQASPAGATHGLRTRPPERGSAAWKRQILSPAADEIVEALADGAPVRDAAGDVPIHDRIAIEAAALLLIQVRRASAWLGTNGDTDSRGNLRPEVDALGRATERLFKALDRLGMTPASRARLGLALARTADLATAMSEPDAERRAELMREAGVDDGDGERG